jgi:very-short-patch-repair endonuclease
VPAVHPAASLGRLATNQHGVFTRRQALDAGFTDGEIDGRVQRRAWVAVDYGVYRAAETPGSWHQRLLAACLAGPAVASHRSAAALWKLTDFPAGVIEVTAVRHRRRWKGDVVWHESVRLDERDITNIENVPLTNATRTILDLGAVVEERELIRALDDAVRRRLTSVPRLQIELERWGTRRRGSGTLRRALARRVDGVVPESALETAFDELVEQYNLPRPSRQWVVRDAFGQFVARVDFAYPAARLAIELQSVQHHFALEARLRDMERENGLAAVNWRMLQFTAHDLRRRPEVVRAKILAALQSAHALLDHSHEGDLRNQ